MMDINKYPYSPYRVQSSVLPRVYVGEGYSFPFEEGLHFVSKVTANNVKLLKDYFHFDFQRITFFKIAQRIILHSLEYGTAWSILFEGVCGKQTCAYFRRETACPQAGQSTLYLQSKRICGISDAKVLIARGRTLEYLSKKKVPSLDTYAYKFPSSDVQIWFVRKGNEIRVEPLYQKYPECSFKINSKSGQEDFGTRLFGDFILGLLNSKTNVKIIGYNTYLKLLREQSK